MESVENTQTPRPTRVYEVGEDDKPKLQITVGQVVGKTTLTGRNQRCPCGSGIKYKNCHRILA